MTSLPEPAEAREPTKFEAFRDFAGRNLAALGFFTIVCGVGIMVGSCARDTIDSGDPEPITAAGPEASSDSGISWPILAAGGATVMAGIVLGVGGVMAETNPIDSNRYTGFDEPREPVPVSPGR